MRSETILPVAGAHAEHAGGLYFNWDAVEGLFPAGMFDGMFDAYCRLLKQLAEPSRDQIREHLSGNYCRCTGYQAIVDAIEMTVRSRKERR